MHITQTTDGWCITNPATTMLDLTIFGTDLRTGVDYLGCKMGWDMDVKLPGWNCKNISYRHWETENRKQPLVPGRRSLQV